MESPETSTPERARTLGAFIDRLVAEIEPLHLALNEAMWQANITGDPAHEQESARLDAALRSVFARPEPLALLQRLAAAGGVPDPLLQRQLVLLINAHRANQVPPDRIARMVTLEKQLESRFNNFRAELDGERVGDNALRDVLRTSEDVALRRRAWEASKQIGAEVREGLLELVRLRNESARAIGYPNYYTMMLTLDELDEGELFALLDALDEGTAPRWERYKTELDARLAARFGVTPAELRPWHYSDPFFQEAPVADVTLDRFFAGRPLASITERFFAAVGLDLRDLMSRADLYEKPGKSQHAFCLSVDRGEDVRVLCNVRPNEYWMSTLLHEFGHAVYDRAIDPALPFLLRTPAHTLTTEASAMLFGRLSKNAAWLERHAGVSGADARAAGEACARTTREQLLVQTRWELVMCHMERALYADPGQDLDALWWELVERFQHVHPPDGRRHPDWASKIHFSVAPVYYHDYMLGEMMASQLERHLLEQVLGGGEGAWRRFVTSREVGGWLTAHVYRHGKSLDWRGTLEQATGAGLDVEAFVRSLEEPPA